jgi:5-methylcytosine-specific restriction endonuclease McrA
MKTKHKARTKAKEESRTVYRLIQIPQQPAIPRSSGWSALRKRHLAKQPTCQACGKKTQLAVHHIIPLHVDKSKELDPTNLITLCENPHSTFCHYTFGHLGISWLRYDANIIADAAVHLAAVQNAA